MENKQVCISVMALYEKFGEELAHCHIVKTVDNELETEYYDLYNSSNLLVCCCGEMCYLISQENGIATLYNEESDLVLHVNKDVKEHFSSQNEFRFMLTDDELKVALFE